MTNPRFRLAGTLWRMPAEGGVATQVTSSPAYDSEPSWSPEGRRLALTRDSGTRVEIWIVNADGTEPRPLIHSYSFSLNPEWAPTGESILYVTMEEDRNLTPGPGGRCGSGAGRGDGGGVRATTRTSCPRERFAD